MGKNYKKVKKKMERGRIREEKMRSGTRGGRGRDRTREE